MPLSSSVDYLPVMDQFIHHWAGLDLIFKLAGEDSEVGLKEFRRLRANLDAAKAALRRRLNDLELARRELETARESAGERVAEFNRRIRAEFPAAGKFSRLPAVPARMAGRGAFLDAMDDALALWDAADRQEAGAFFSGPLLLRDGLSRSGFSGLRESLDQAFVHRSLAETALFEQRLIRQELQSRAKTLMTLYRRKVGALYALDSPEVITLPRLTPKPQARKNPAPVQKDRAVGPPEAGPTWTHSGSGDSGGKSTVDGTGGESRDGSGMPPSAMPQRVPADLPIPVPAAPPDPVMTWRLRIGPAASGAPAMAGFMFVLPLGTTAGPEEESRMPPPRRKKRRRAWPAGPVSPAWRRGLRTG